MYLKTHTSDGTLLIAICDRELIGQTFSDGLLRLEVSEFFYRGEIASSSDIRDALEHAMVANLVGERSVGHALEGGFIIEENILIIDGIPHAQMAAAASLPVNASGATDVIGRD